MDYGDVDGAAAPKEVEEEEEEEEREIGVAAPKEVEEEEEEEEREIEDLEREIKAMAQRIIDSRRTVSDRLSNALSSHLIALRPPLSPSIAGADSISDVDGQSQLSEGAPPEGDDQQMLQKLEAFSAKALKNIEEMPIILRRMKDCIVRIDKLDECNEDAIHSVFKQK